MPPLPRGVGIDEIINEELRREGEDVVMPNSDSVFYSNLTSPLIGRWFYDPVNITEKKPKKIKKTPKERYEELKAKLIGIKEENIDRVLKPFLMERDYRVLRKILDDSKHLRTSHDLRCFIEEYMLSNR